MSANSEKWQWVDEDPIERLLRSSREPAPVNLLAEGRAQFERLSFEEAAGSYSAAVAAEPDHPTAHFDLAVCLEKLERWKPAAISFRRALELDPSRAEALIGLGSCLLHLDSPVDALDCFEAGLRSGDLREAGLLGRAVALQKLGKYDESESCYRELLEIDPGAAEPLANLISLSAAREDLPAVAEYSQRLLRLHPLSKAALQGMAMVAIGNHDRNAAVDYCARLVEVDPDSFEGRFNLRFAQQRMQAPERETRSIA